MPKKFVKEIILSNHKKHVDYNKKFPNGESFILSGPNGAGKSTILGAISRLIQREAPVVKGVNTLDETPQQPITTGKDSGFIKAILGADGVEYEVEERYTRLGKARYKFRRLAENGQKDDLNPPQERFKQIFGNVTDFSPLIDLSGVKQFEFLQQAFKMDVSGYTMKRQHLVEDRKVSKGTVKRLESRLDNPEFRTLGISDVMEYREEKSVKEVLAKKKDVVAIQTRLNLASKSIEARRQTKQKIEKNKQEIEDLERRILALKMENETYEKQLQLTTPPEKLYSDISKEKEEAIEFNLAIDKELEEIGEHNRKVALVKTWLESKKELEEARVKVSEEDKKIKQLDQDLRSGMTKVAFADIYEGLELKYELDDDNSVKDIGLYLRGLPFHRSQQSFGEMIKVIIKLSTFINPDGLHFIPVGNWNLLDTKNQHAILEYAKENENVQLGIEKVDDSTEIVTEFIEL